MNIPPVTKLPRVPSRAYVDAHGEPCDDPGNLCAYWERGCNGTTEGPSLGRLTLCADCEERFAHNKEDAQ